jgi:hypothetical protein
MAITNTILNEFSKYFVSLTATSPVCVALGTRLVSNKNLYLGKFPSIATPCISILPYGGAPPTSKDKYNSSLQIRIKTKTNLSSIRTCQAVINTLHMNHNVMASGNGIVLANQSQPIPLQPEEGGEWQICVSNFTIKHVKL